MARISLAPLLLLTALCWAGPLSAAANAQVDISVDVDSVDVDLGGAAAAAGSVGNIIEDAVGSLTPSGSGEAARLDQSGAIEAVKSHRALPLEQIMTKARFHTQGEIVDAQLISLNGFLLYELKVVEANGDVDELYFYALSGELVQTN